MFISDLEHLAPVCPQEQPHCCGAGSLIGLSFMNGLLSLTVDEAEVYSQPLDETPSQISLTFNSPGSFLSVQQATSTSGTTGQAVSVISIGTNPVTGAAYAASSSTVTSGAM
jgi:hypothetical protein